MADKRVKVAVVGMGGYGMHYVERVLNNSDELNVECVGMVDVFPEKCKFIEEVRAKNIPVYGSIEELYENHSPELVFISTPIQFHYPQACSAMEHGSNVLCEKPAAATKEDVEKMIEISKKTGKFLAIGYQRCYASSEIKAKQDILDGKYGKPIKFKCIIVQRRQLAYFERGWAGKIKIGDSFVYDSVANNSCAHYLHNLFFMAGDKLNTSAFPVKSDARLYRVNDIENFDTITAKFVTDNGVEMYFAATQCGEDNFLPYTVCEFEKGTITFEQQGETVVGRLNSGEEIVYGSLKEENFEKIPLCIDAVRGSDTVYCDAASTLPHATAIDYIQKNCEIKTLAGWEIINATPEEESPVYVKVLKGLKGKMLECFENESLLEM